MCYNIINLILEVFSMRKLTIKNILLGVLAAIAGYGVAIILLKLFNL